MLQTMTYETLLREDVKTLQFDLTDTERIQKQTWATVSSVINDGQT